ncbi:MAG: polyphosphate kinase 1 [Oscillospiraceae bacterium]|nr:polyphosphate kinase 1 [Oscillospiraceae bacterium]
MNKKKATRKLYFQNRELSWLKFNERVLNEALAPSNPLFEQCRFLSIFSSNLDEFFMIRAASIQDQIKANYNLQDYSGYRPEKLISKIMRYSRRLVKREYEIYHGHILPLLKEQGINIIPAGELSDRERAFAREYYKNKLHSMLSPSVLDKNHLFPLFKSGCLNLFVSFYAPEECPLYAAVEIPSGYDRLIPLGGGSFLLLEDLIALNLDMLFPGMDVKFCGVFRVSRNADLEYDEDDASDLLDYIKKSLKKRKWGAVIRLETARQTPPDVTEFLKKKFRLQKSHIFAADGPVSMDFLAKLGKLVCRPQLCCKPFVPWTKPPLRSERDIFAAVARKDYLVFHPYESFEPVMRFVFLAAGDPGVVAIKQTLYRVSGDSPIIKALAKAAENGKQVTVLLELKARFDEENNIRWANELERAGCHVIYGRRGLKTHAKVTLVFRREGEAIKKYVHFGTGNYNDVTAGLYTDLGLFSARKKYTDDASEIFTMLANPEYSPKLTTLAAAPAELRGRLYGLIETLIKEAGEGQAAEIKVKINSLCDPELIRLLYKASQSGVKIKLLVRGICSLCPQVEGLSENIEVRSIVGRFLEHSRIFCFSGGKTEVFISSADWMPRNLNTRIELLTPVLYAPIKKQLIDIFNLCWADNTKSYALINKNYEKISPADGEEALNSQEYFIKSHGRAPSSL